MSKIQSFDLSSLQLVSIHLPGRGARFGEDAYSDMKSLVPALTDEIETLCMSLPFAFFGHSLGSLIAFEVPLFGRIG